MSDESQNENVVQPDFGGEDTPAIAFGIHVALLENGGFGIQATGEPNLGEMQMMLSRALKSVEARMMAETTAQLMSQLQEQQRIITPGR